ncbi:hypothetical protein [Flavobacterium sp. '19STA2R22 D10 B1']|uniref:hypothetical protein n=1 Tax=Flavobacterium aerium TaxID=3037261 RepID=UPI00278C7C6F|nr:hypothetical protein [Flavobacterium sp. '19STA2R22 D10 B1']
MMNTTKQRIEEIRDNGFSLDLGDMITQSFENFQKIALHAGLGLLLLSIILVVLVMGSIGASFGFENFAEQMTDFQVTDISSVYIIIYFLGITILTSLINPFVAGIFRLANQADNGEKTDFSMIFHYYKSKYLKDLIFASFLITSFNFMVSFLFETFGLDFVGTIISYFVQLLTILFIPLIIFGNLNATEAIKGSFIVVQKQFWIILLLMVLAGVGAMVGLIAICIGMFFTLPFVYSMQYVIYKNSIGNVTLQDELDEIGQSYDEY